MLEELGALYLEFGARGKAIEILRQAKNLCEDGASKAKLLSDITTAEETPVGAVTLDSLDEWKPACQ